MMGELTRDKVVELELVDRYLRKRLSDVEASAFEQYFFDCPETLQDLEIAQALMAEANWPADELNAKATGRGWLATLADWLATPRLGPALASGFAVMLVAPLLATITFYESQTQGAASPAATANAAVVAVPLTRGAGDDFRTAALGSLPEATADLVLILEVGYSEHRFHRVIVERWPGQEVVASIDRVLLQNNEDMTITLPGASLGAGDYRASVYPMSLSAAALASFDFSLE